MIVTPEGAVVGSVNVAELARLVDDGTVNPDLVDPAHLAAVRAHQEAATVESDEVEDLSKLRKDELVERAEAAGLDSSGTKAELVERLQAGVDVEPVNDGGEG